MRDYEDGYHFPAISEVPIQIMDSDVSVNPAGSLTSTVVTHSPAPNIPFYSLLAEQGLRNGRTSVSPSVHISTPIVFISKSRRQCCSIRKTVK